MITHELKSIDNYKDLNTYSELETTLDEIITVYSTVFSNRNIEFRTMDDDPLFVDNDGDG
jgi:hypothetical protein